MIKINSLCMGCMKDKGETDVCPACGFTLIRQQSPHVLPYFTVLRKRFLIGRVLGKPGGFGITYLAWDLALQTTVAIKEFFPGSIAARMPGKATVVPNTGNDGQAFKSGQDAFLTEARTLAQFDHPNIVKVRDFFTENNTAYLVMDYYEGISLTEYLQRKNDRLSTTLALNIMMPVLSGLNSVHQKGFLHRDVKTSNIYMAQDSRVILLDFGAARLALGQQEATLTVILTPGFAPFEQYHRKGKQGPWTDIYACGATLYQMVTGVTPPDAIERSQTDELIPPHLLNSSINPACSEAIVTAMALEPSSRPPTIEAFQRLLEPNKIYHEAQPFGVPAASIPPKKELVSGIHSKGSRSTSSMPGRTNKRRRRVDNAKWRPTGLATAGIGLSALVLGYFLAKELVTEHPDTSSHTAVSEDYAIESAANDGAHNALDQSVQERSNQSAAAIDQSDAESSDVRYASQGVDDEPAQDRPWSHDAQGGNSKGNDEAADPWRVKDQSVKPSMDDQLRAASPPPPPAAITACNRKRAGDRCSIHTPFDVIAGQCLPINADIACVPAGPPPPLDFAAGGAHRQLPPHRSPPPSPRRFR